MVIMSSDPFHRREDSISTSIVTTANTAMSITTSLISLSTCASVRSRAPLQASSASCVDMTSPALINSMTDTSKASASGSMVPISGKPTPCSQRLTALSVTQILSASKAWVVPCCLRRRATKLPNRCASMCASFQGQTCPRSPQRSIDASFARTKDLLALCLCRTLPVGWHVAPEGHAYQSIVSL